MVLPSLRCSSSNVVLFAVRYLLPLITLTTFHTEPAPRVGGVRVGACVLLGVARLVLLVVVFVQVRVLGDHQGHVLKMELVLRLAGSNMTTVGMCIAVCVLH